MKRVAVNSAQPVDEEAKLKFRHQRLVQDHLDLQKEVVSNKNKLEAAKQKRDILLAEIRFLRRRQRHLLEIKSAETQPQVVQHKHSNVQPKKFSRKRNNDSQVEQEQGEKTVWEPIRVEKKPKKWFINDKRVGKKKIQVQDEVALNV